eukprot:7862451-Pyramimonas_sp.AAC.1
MEHFRQCQITPLDMLRSHSFAAEKANNTMGIAGKRSMYTHCAASMAWHSGIHRRALPIVRPHFAHGGLAHRSRENAVLALLATKWRCEQAGKSLIMSSSDCTNAFASSDRALLREHIDRTAEEHDLPHAYGALEHTALSIQAADER